MHHFHYTTEHGVSFCGVVGKVSETNQYLVVLCEAELAWPEQLVFIFEAQCGYPKFVRRYVNEVDAGGEIIAETDFETVLPKRLLTAEVAGLLHASADAVAGVIAYHTPTVVVEPSEKFKRVMRQLIRVQEHPELLDKQQVPPYLQEHMRTNFEMLLGYLRQAPNALQAERMAELTLDALKQYGLEDAGALDATLN